MTDCPNCGKTNEDQQSNCVDCGQPLTTEPMCEEPTVQESIPTEEMPQTEPVCTAQVDGFTPSPRKKSKIGLYIGGGILGIVAILGIVLLVLTMMNPRRAVTNAANKTLDALNHQLGSFESLENFTEARSNYMAADRNAEHFTFAIGSADAGSICLEVDVIADYSNRIADAEIRLGVEGGNSISIPYCFDDSGFSMTAPQLLEDTLLFMDYDFLNEMVSEVYGDLLKTPEDMFSREPVIKLGEDAEQAVEALKNAFNQVLLNVETQKGEIYTHSEFQWTTYPLTFRQEDLDALQTSMTELVTAVFESETLSIYSDIMDAESFNEELVPLLMQVFNQSTVYINDQGYLVGYSFIDEDETRNMIALEGAENPWARYAFYEDEEVVLQGELTNADGTTTLTFSDGQETLVHLTYVDATGTFTLTIDEEAPTISLRVGAEDEQAMICFAIGDEALSIGFDVTCGATTETPEKLSAGTIYDLATITEDESTTLLTEAMMALYMDQELTTIVEEMVGILEGMGLTLG